jgi:uncharacterized membrane protein
MKISEVLHPPIQLVGWFGFQLLLILVVAFFVARYFYKRTHKKTGS